MKKFSARIFIIGINPYVFVPVPVLKWLFDKAGKSKGPVPIKVRLNKKEFIQTLVKYQGAWRLYLNTPMREAAGIDVGDMAKVEIDFDPKPRVIPMNPELKNAFAQNKKAKEVFDKLSPYRQKEIVRYINSLKTDESVKKNIDKVIQHLKGKEQFAGRNL
ncbi:MAG TPA: YdeI/OmpD-associated family protein [Bacteroidia bacterium]|nr:YdeI/OmpD-associated family protein [Bacteroidia bacterium]